MLLHFYTAAVEPKTLQELFAIPPSTFSRIINKAEHALSRALDKLPQSAVKWPSKATQRYWASKSNAREPLVTGVFAFADGKNLRAQQPSHTELQNAQYNGWLYCVFVTGVLCFGLDGTLIWCKHNCPGSWNDGDMSRSLQDILVDPLLVDLGMKIACDSAFPIHGRCSGRIVTPLKSGDLERQSMECRRGLQAISGCITSLRQAAEWGMGAVGKVYRQQQLPLPYRPDTRRVRLKNVFKLYNYRVRTTGISQIKNVFDVKNSQN
ncbi:hypothetical protein AC1031_001516 [Aphanomyces cochlioides]|nr:hypothetical protein AC1031_001516 [Aphanomyces cochlioides]